MSRGLLLSLLVAVSALSPSDVLSANAGGGGVPKLVVNILIDQLRTDYLEAFMPLYGDEGFRRLLQEGRVYSQAEYPMSRPDCASSAATVATGTTPAVYHFCYGHNIEER